MRDAFRRLSARITDAVGSPWALLVAIGIIATWAVLGPVTRFSDTWQLAINTGTTIVTFLMVFVIQASQNREARATQLKLDELLRAQQGARNELIDVEEADDETVEIQQQRLRQLVAAAREADPDILERAGVQAPREETGPLR